MKTSQNYNHIIRNVREIKKVYNESNITKVWFPKVYLYYQEANTVNEYSK